MRAGETEVTWAEDISKARLRWMEDGHWFEIFIVGYPETVTFTDRAGMIRLAESMPPATREE